jgi:hypothetical protein
MLLVWLLLRPTWLLASTSPTARSWTTTRESNTRLRQGQLLGLQGLKYVQCAVRSAHHVDRA